MTQLGPKIETLPFFPNRTNVEFAQVLDQGRIRMRVWERGVGVTLACGTGACATAVAAIRRGLTGRKVELMLDGGILSIEWREEDGHVLMTGPTAMPFRGRVELDKLMTVEVVTFGCRLNAYESEAIKARAGEAQLRDAVVVNTCAVTAEAVRQSRPRTRREPH